MTHKRSAVSALVLALLAVTLPSAAARAQGVPSDSLLRGFQPSGDYVLIVNGKPAGGEIYLNDKIPAFLVLSSSIPSPVLLTPRAGTVETVHIMKIAKQKDGSVDLLADAVLAPAGQFQMKGENVTFSYQGRNVSLNPKPPLVGLHQAQELKTHNPLYARTANAYTPNGAAIAALKGSKPATVRVYFGSWCPHCRQHVPLILKVQDQLQGTPIKFEYFGLKRPPEGWNDPEIKRLNVRGVPTGIVYRDGKEIGRITGDNWNAPEVTLSKIVGGTAKAAKGK
ncbi:MAG TPA: thioredoxin family protein [Thermoanaerobaculia bacterium]|jgi:thiol-disulfide isomerase/thioredoxin|nr:thioredoxin family protein [Thermoanaerobaculia bacterium]